MYDGDTGYMVYLRLFPVIVLVCAAVGVGTFAANEVSASLHCFIAVFFGIRLDNHIELRREAEAEAAAAAGWARLRGPVAAI